MPEEMTSAPGSEQALIERCRQGDEQAFRELVDQHKGLVFALVARAPFRLDLTAFFRIADTNVAAARIANMKELVAQLHYIVQGAARKILATHDIHQIMVDRATFGAQFTQEVATELANWGVEDYWETPNEFLNRDGDCEDFAIAKYKSLRALGLGDDQLRIVVLQDLNLRIAHAVLVVLDGGKAWVLDNQIDQVIDADRIRHYRPYYSINASAYWLHR